LASTLSAQWIQTSGLSSHSVWSFTSYQNQSGGTSLFAGTDSGGIYLSTNHGSTWKAINEGLTHLFDVYALASIPDGSGRIYLYAGILGGGICASYDNGRNWIIVHNGLTNLYDVWALAVIDSELFAGMFGGGVYRSTDYGTYWSSMNNGLTNANVLSLAVSPNDTGGTTIFAGTFGGGVFRSTNNGKSWNAVNDGLANLYPIALAVDGTDLYAGTWNGGVFLSTDNGTSWSPANSGIEAGNVFALAGNGMEVFAGTYGGGVYRSTNKGASWKAVNTGLSNLQVLALAISDTNLFAGTYKGGVWKNTLTDFPLLRLNLRAVSGSNRVELVWPKISRSSLARCRIFSGTSPHPTGVIDSTAQPSDTSKIIYGLTNGTTYYFRVAPVDSDGKMQGYSFDAALIPGAIVSIDQGWNLLSVSTVRRDFNTKAVFPNAGAAFTFDAGYVRKDPLENGIGYWLHFDNADSIILSDTALNCDTINIRNGWNLIGSLSIPIRTSSISTIPGGLRTSAFYGYRKGYYKAEMLMPGKGYWVKANQKGKLILAVEPDQNMVNRIKIMSDSNIPPPSPDDNISPERFSLYQAYPNPFNATTIIRYDIPVECNVSLKLFDLLGREIDELANGTKQQGEYLVQWNATSYASGVYFYRLQAGSFVETKKLLLMK
jgi:photosystem II stability/assembly factor-like uncharacterized protein